MGREAANNQLIGSYSARLDHSGRLKIPEKFRDLIEKFYGQDVFVTSLTDEAIQIYPLSVWEEMTSVASEGALHLRPDVRKFLLRVNLKGSHHQIDAKGRDLINQALREKAKLAYARSLSFSLSSGDKTGNTFEIFLSQRFFFDDRIKNVLIPDF